MFEETRPILAQHPAILDNTTNTGGKKSYLFQGAEGVDLTFSITEGYIQSVVHLFVGERGFAGEFQKPKGLKEDARGINVGINVFPHRYIPDFVSADEFYYTTEERLTALPKSGI